MRSPAFPIMRRMKIRTVSGALVLAGGLAAILSASLVFVADQPRALAPIVLAFAWYTPGAIAARAHPDSPAATFLLSVGALHLVSYAISAGLGLDESPTSGWIPYLIGWFSLILYALGFAALTWLFVGFPDGQFPTRARRVVAGAAGIAAVMGPSILALTSSRLMLPLEGGPGLPAPSPLPVGSQQIDFSVLPMLLVLAGLVLLATRTRLETGEGRRALSWPLGAATVLLLMLVATPAATRVLGEAVWSVTFVLVVASLPFALLAGLMRFRVLEAELYVARTVAYAAVFVLILSGYALSGELVAGSQREEVSVLVTVIAAFTGVPLRNRLESIADRWLTGDRIRRRVLVKHLAETLDPSDLQTLGQRAVDIVAEGLEVSWVRVVFGRSAIASTGNVSENMEVTVPLLVGTEEVGQFECGPRHGGWSEEDVELLTVLARHAALALQSADLAVALQAKIEDLRSSRTRLVQAEEAVRRKVERDLHDGVQQQIVALLASLETLRALVEPDSPAGEIVAMARQQAASSLVEFREVVQGIHPPLLGDKGLVAAVEGRVSLLPIPVEIDVDQRLIEHRFAPEIEGAAYYVVSEALTNVLKHSGADRARVSLASDDSGLVLSISDSGVGFEPSLVTSALEGIRDRVEALGGHLAIATGAGRGTTVTARLPERVGAHV